MASQIPTELLPLPFVVAIFARLKSGALQFLGTGTVIGQSLVLTCKHVVQHADSTDDDPEFRSSLVIRAVDGTVIDVVGDAFDPPLDLAILRSTSPLAIEPVPFATRLDQSFVDHFDRLDLRVVGFPASSQKQSTFSPLQYTLPRTAGGWLETLQLDGGIDEGCSGGPALVQNCETWQCFGIAALGGITAAKSRVICANIILSSEPLALASDHSVRHQPVDLGCLKRRRIATPPPCSQKRIVQMTIGVASVVVITLMVLALVIWPPHSEVQGLLQEPGWAYAGNVLPDPTVWNGVFSDLDSSIAGMDSAMERVESCRERTSRNASLSKPLDEKQAAMSRRRETLVAAKTFSEEEHREESFQKQFETTRAWPDQDLATAYLAYYVMHEADDEQGKLVGINELRRVTKNLTSANGLDVLQDQLKVLLSPRESPWCEIGYELLFAEHRPTDAFDTIEKLAKIDRASVRSTTLWMYWVERELLQRLARILARYGYSDKQMQSLVRLCEQGKADFPIQLGITYLSEAASDPSFAAQFRSADKRICKGFFESWLQQKPQDRPSELAPMKKLISVSDDFGKWFFESFDDDRLKNSGTGPLQLIPLNRWRS